MPSGLQRRQQEFRLSIVIFLLLLIFVSSFAFVLPIPTTTAAAATPTHTTTTMSADGAACPLNKDKKHCVPCEGGIPALTPEQLQSSLPSLPLWQINEKQAQLSRSFTAKNFASARGFINKVGEIAEREGHHPDLHLTGYRNVEVVLWTHAVGGLTENDLIMAR